MKTIALLGSLLLAASTFWAKPAFASDNPQILSVHLDHGNVVITATVPSGLRKVTLQSRTRVVGSSWIPRAVARLDGTGGEVTFTLPVSEKLEILRVQADENDPLPANFYAGTNSFVGGALPAAGAGGVVLDVAPGGAPTTTARQVVESDIWTIDGNTLYFFNSLRGLQVIDIGNPAAPLLRSQYPLPAAGEQMYLIGNYVVLLARDGCGWWGDSSESRAIVLDVSGTAPSLVASLPVPGYISESRLVGSALYVASQSYRQKTNDNSVTWEWGTVISSFDLSEPALPAVKDSLWFNGYGNTISATDQYLYVVASDPSNWQQSILNIVDISSPSGEMKARATIRPNGRIADKFKINQNGNVLTTISIGWNENRRSITVLQNWGIENPDVPVKIADLQLADGEAAFATRFDGNRVYIVTYFRIDPLWVVDLSDPAKPAIVGELQVPGWSTYIDVQGTRLLAMGVDPANNWHSTVSLYNVEDAASPSLVSRVDLGNGDYSWSEANQDEKAFRVFPDLGLILVPVTSYGANGSSQYIQLIDYDKAGLKNRGAIEHKFQPRRATVQRGSIFSISGRELLAVDPADRDHPMVQGSLDLAWSVNRLFVQGDFLVQVDAGQFWWNGSPEPRIFISPKDDSSKVLSSIPLPLPHPIVGASVKNNRLYLAQARSAYGGLVVFNAADDSGTNNFFVTTIDLSALPKLKIVDRQAFPQQMYAWSSLQALWPKDDLLVWAAGGGGYPWFWLRGGIDLAMPAGGSAQNIAMPIWWWGGGSYGQLLALSTADPDKLAFASYVDLHQTNQWWNYSKGFAVKGGLVYLSHQTSDCLGCVTTTDGIDPKTSQTIQPVWFTRYFLDVVDFSDSASPAIRKPVNIPGQLENVSNDGAVIYTRGNHYNADLTTDYTEWVDAASYDGVSAFLVDSLHLPNGWPHPVAWFGGTLFLGVPATANSAPFIQSWELSVNGKFELTAESRTVAANDLRVIGDALVVNVGSDLWLYSTAGISAPKPLGISRVGGCVYPPFENADGNISTGVFLPLNEYGVLKLEPTMR